MMTKFELTLLIQEHVEHIFRIMFKQRIDIMMLEARRIEFLVCVYGIRLYDVGWTIGCFLPKTGTGPITNDYPFGSSTDPILRKWGGSDLREFAKQTNRN